ncbi:unnamed protein product [Malassezia sympodialis ATCC 42132]|uniref:Similar to S.cerevisiae protein TCB3 (Cortical ER protein involved in ER-plasma membrane tethering) n=1 Tax=Malassezia sympodialis (strain ATCC 42132) TaxID=1230383 RepID=M5E838_MALS4|nr:uncharacterized protein MSY001_1006 [Malassezia sympodialis ATCC 42132]CCU98300.1 unnamed protein product [Malassezia sympodialis ATCC 42132]SHO75901.1 Similar to S.cerevisiae protein TCB3 (Cortical ER protein involved in ER-plasma membrane tethering) [Malassezia sympodialis ATCC 42132]|eukprot:XP_018739615.1 uncharacterized protein MSY001_1006 [Malassezia sympodialis ATCC 42132]
MVQLNPFKGGNNDGPDPKEAEKMMAHELEAEGAEVQTFDENASPEEKGKAAKKAMDGVKPRGELAEQKRLKEKEESDKLYRSVPSDISGTRTRSNVSLRDIDRASRERGQMGGDLLIPGALPAGAPSLNIPDWYTVGWVGESRRLLGLKPDEFDIDRSRLRESDVVSTFVHDAYYGYLWTDAAVIIGSCVITYLLTRFGTGWGIVLIVASVAGTYYTTSVRRTRQRIRDDVSRELARRRMLSENETAHWINHFLARFWLIYEPVLSATIIQSVDEVLRDNCPPFLDSLRLTTFTLGTKAPMVDSVRTRPDTEDDVIVMDWKVNFTPSDVQDLSVRQASRKINPKVVLTIRVGKGMVGAGLPVLVENMSFVGTMRFRLKLISSFPHVQMVDLSFLQPPNFDFELKPIGGSTFGLDVAALPGLSGFIHNQVHSALGPMMYSPNQFSLNLEELMSGTPLDATAGVLQVTIWSARDLKRLSFSGGAPNPYFIISVNDGKEVARTRTKELNANPTFKDTNHVLIKDLQGLLVLELMDDKGNRPHTRLGVTQVDLSSLADNPSPGQMNKAIMYGDKPLGSVQFSLDYFPVMKPEVGPDGLLQPLPETAAGILRLTLNQARELVSAPEIEGDMSIKARLLLNRKLIKETAEIKTTLSPIFEDVTEMLVVDRYGSVLTVEMVDTRKGAKNAVMASLSVKIDDLVHARDRKQDWFPFPETERARLRMSGQWKPVLMSGSINGSNSYRPAIGALKFWVRGARDLKNVEVLSGGKSDPYAVLRVNNLPVTGTNVVDDNLNPVWNQVLYAPVHSTAEVVRFEVFDYQSSTHDRSLGFCDIPVGELAEDNIEDSVYPYTSRGRRSFREPLKQPNGTTKGVVDFDVEFVTAMHVEGANFIEQNKKLEAERREKAGLDAQVNGDSALTSPDAIEEAGAATTAGNAHLNEDEGEDDDPDAGVELSPEQVLQSPSGVVVFNMIEGKFPRSRAQLEVVFDDCAWPAYTTEPRKKDYNWDEVGEYVVRELDVSNVWFRARIGPRDSDVIAEYSCNTRSLLEKALTQPTTLQLTPTGEHGSLDPTKMIGNTAENLKPENMAGAISGLSNMPAKAIEAGSDLADKGKDAISKLSEGELLLASGGCEVKISCRYIPMDVHLEAVESVVNQGILTIEVLSCANLSVADRGGKSDPYVLFQDDGVTVARSKTVRRSLNPVFNEILPEVMITSRLTHEYCFNVRDWDQVGSSDPLGVAVVNLAELEPFETHERTYQLKGEGSNPESTITVRLTFHPRYLNNRTTKGSNLIGGVASGVIGGIGGIGKGVASGGLHIGRGFAGILGIHKKEATDQAAAERSAAQEYAAAHEPPQSGHDVSDKAEGDANSSAVQSELQPSKSRQSHQRGHSMSDMASVNDGGSTTRRRHRVANLFKKR